MAVAIAVIIVAALVVIVGGVFLVRSRRGGYLEPPASGGVLAPERPPEAVPEAPDAATEAPPDVVLPEAPGALTDAVLPEAAPDVVVPEPPPEAPPEVPVKPRIRDRVGRARAVIAGYVSSVLARSSIDAEVWDDLEEALIRADVGVATTTELLDGLRQRVKSESLTTPSQLLDALKQQVKTDLSTGDRTLRLQPGVTNVWLFVGVNGVGKTTTIGKVGLRMADEGHQVVMAAGDTFRAAASEQLELWADRVGADLVRGAEGGDPGSVVFDAVQRAASKGADLVLADTAGRLHTKVNLMEELRKVRRVAAREPGVVSESLLVLDATTGQNGLNQAREFTSAVEVSGVVLTKLDGTAKGGIVLAIQNDLGLPVKLVGVGEGPADLIDFDPDEFVEALFAEP